MLVVALVMYVGFFMKTRKTHKGRVVAKGAGTETRCGVQRHGNLHAVVCTQQFIGPGMSCPMPD